MVQHFISEFHSVTSIFAHPQLISDQKNTCIAHSKRMEIYHQGCNIATPIVKHFISEFHRVLFICTHPQLISIQKNACIAHSKHMGAYHHGCHIATPIVQHFISEFFVSSSLHTPSAHLRPKTTCIGHSNTWKLRLPHYHSRRGTFYFGISLCPLHLHTSPAHLKLKTRCIALSERMATHHHGGHVDTPNVQYFISEFHLSPLICTHPQLILHQNNTCTAHSKHMETYHHGCHIATATPRSCSCTHRPFRFHPATERIARSSEAVGVAQSVGSEGGGQN